MTGDECEKRAAEVQAKGIAAQKDREKAREFCEAFFSFRASECWGRTSERMRDHLKRLGAKHCEDQREIEPRSLGNNPAPVRKRLVRDDDQR